MALDCPALPHVATRRPRYILPGTKLLLDIYVTASFDRQAISGYMSHGAWSSSPSRVTMGQYSTTASHVDSSRVIRNEASGQFS
jgi:hypothetical protein